MLRLEFDGAHQAWPVFFRSCLVLIDRIDRELESEAGLPLSWFEVLSQLGSRPGAMMPMKQLADSICLSKSGVSRLVDRMADRGLVKRAPCQEDGRVIFACLTPEGRAAYERARPAAYRCIEEHFSRHITPDEASAMTGALMKVLSATGCQHPGV
ncbi:MAG: MarR family transcriptional regulator [Actinomycetota bacterium]|nr:MarR family transcriptional regulator [Actinomycetota bacterium]